jgi:tetratricopeptide (TPR) repeat protein
MGEHGAEPANDVDGASPPLGGPDGAAVAVALGARGPELAPEAAEFLRKQSRMLDVQMEHLHEQRALQIDHLKQQDKHLRLRFFGDRLRIGLQLLGVGFGLVLAVVLAAAAWSAHEDHGVAIEAFSVPPDLAARGLTGQVAASQLLDRLAELQAQTLTSRPASTYANDWGSDIKVEIPETGVSIGELNRYLRQWLGSETRISGEIVRTPTGLVVTARAGDAPGRRFEGAEGDVDKLIGQAAEAVYRQTQPYRYAVYLASQNRHAEALAAYSRLAQSGPPEDRAWAYVGWSSLLYQDGRVKDAARMAETAQRLDPRLEPAYAVMGLAFAQRGLVEQNLGWVRRELQVLRSGRTIGLSPAERANQVRLMRGLEAHLTGDYAGAVAILRTVTTVGVEGQAQGYSTNTLTVMDLALDHDVAESIRFAGHSQGGGGAATYAVISALQEWAPTVREYDAFVRSGRPAGIPGDDSQARLIAWTIAPALAHVGRIAEAEALFPASADDCYDCLLVRGDIAALKGNMAAAARWYAEAARQGPSLPFAHTQWGQAQLASGDLDGAIAKLAEAHRKSPHYADPVELWGEALMHKGDYAGAIGRFAAADKDAPRWGRNHLRWGEALLRAGRYREARAQFEAANGMDLSRPERAALDVFLNRTARGPLHG